MGLDGGTKITRSDVLRGQSWRMAQKDNSHSTRGGCITTSTIYQEEKLEKKDENLIKWTSCTLSGEILENPIVSDYIGNLYNKQAIVEYLLGRTGHFKNEEAKYKYLNQKNYLKENFNHLKKLKDVFEIKLEIKDKNGNIKNDITCPITNLSCLNVPFSALDTCGHIFSDRAIREMSDEKCMTCGKVFSKQNIISINISEEKQKKLRYNNLIINNKKRKRKSSDIGVKLIKYRN